MNTNNYNNQFIGNENLDKNLEHMDM